MIKFQANSFILCDHVRNSHDPSVLQSTDIARRKYKMNLKGLYHVDTAVLDQFCAELIT